MMNIWKLAGWDTLYTSMYRFTDASWYAALQDALLFENQDLLVGLRSYPLMDRPKWRGNADAAHVYLYEEVLLKNEVTMHAFLRNSGWFADEVAARGWSLIWSGLQVTGRPSLLCFLWSVPDVATTMQTLEWMANDRDHAVRYASMIAQMTTLSRKHLYPDYTERLDERIRAGETKPIVCEK
jgi:hypothetical protein